MQYSRLFSKCKFYLSAGTEYDECIWHDDGYCTNRRAIDDKNLLKALKDL